MRNSPLLACLSAGLAVAIAGCAGDSAGRSQGKTSTASRGASALSPAQSLPLVYSSFLNPLPLTPAQLQEILQVAIDACPQGRQLWFIHVRCHRPEASAAAKSGVSAERYRVVVYYTPDQQSPRLRKGRCAYIDNEIDPARRRQVIATLAEGEAYAWPALENYVQVSDPTRPFDATLGDAPPAIPSESDLPIHAPGGIEDLKLISVVDAARTAHADDPFADSEEPLLRITLEGGTYQVDFGWQAGPQNAKGSRINVKRTIKGYQAESGVASWAS